MKLKRLSNEEIENIVRETWRMSSYLDGDENKAIARKAEDKAWKQVEDRLTKAKKQYAADMDSGRYFKTIFDLEQELNQEGDWRD